VSPNSTRNHQQATWPSQHSFIAQVHCCEQSGAWLRPSQLGVWDLYVSLMPSSTCAAETSMVW
jgi:hypothetical protein